MRSEKVVLALPAPPSSLDVKVWDTNDGGGGDLVGAHTKDLRSEKDDERRRLDESSSWSQSAQWLELKDAKGKPAGRVQLALDWQKSAGDENTVRQRAILCCRYVLGQKVLNLAPCAVGWPGSIEARLDGWGGQN